MFHIINTNSPNNYNSITDLVNAGTGSYICNNNIPAGLSPTRWAKKYQVFSSGGGLAWANGTDLANAIVGTLQSGAAQYVMLDELDNGSRGDARNLIVQTCTAMAAYPQYAGRWGAFLSGVHLAAVLNSSDPNYAAIDALLQRNAILAAEMYVTQWAYHYASGGSGSATLPAPNYPAGDTWLGNLWMGDASTARFNWLAQRKIVQSSSSRLTVVFSVYDQDLNRTQKQNAFMNHLFYVWRHKTAYPNTLLAANGGAGTYKWESIGDTGRDAVFQSAWNYYCRDFNAGTGAAGPYT